ncbi:MAG TPA: glucose-1-phosphate thymidylyltransferase RfbA [Thermohalobaculum sp.]|nr:glucose-1-phosphate thymidylyltransferase RfbA [Thermohalobaculum sp.]
MRKRKGIVLAGGSGTRLHPITLGVSKQLLPVYDKPMVYYPLAVLMMAGIEEIAVITTPPDQPAFRRLLGDGSQLRMRFEYIAQPSPDGLAQAFILAEAFLDGAPSALVLGDNIFHGTGLERLLAKADRQLLGARVFGHPVADPARYGVIEADARGRALSLEEKPARPRSNLAATGLYFFDHQASARARTLTPSARGELEITALLDTYLAEGALEVSWLGAGYAWFDTGTHDSLLEAAAFVRTVEHVQGLKLGCLEEIAFRRGLIDAGQLMRLARPLERTGYGRHLLALADASGSARPAAELRQIA